MARPFDVLVLDDEEDICSRFESSSDAVEFYSAEVLKRTVANKNRHVYVYLGTIQKAPPPPPPPAAVVVRREPRY